MGWEAAMYAGKCPPVRGGFNAGRVFTSCHRGVETCSFLSLCNTWIYQLFQLFSMLISNRSSTGTHADARRDTPIDARAGALVEVRPGMAPVLQFQHD